MLKQMNKDLYFHKGKYECDFLIREGFRIIEAIQVTLSFGKNKEREVAGLLEAMNEHKLQTGLILTEDESDEFRVGKKRVMVKPIWKWLLEDKDQI